MNINNIIRENKLVIPLLGAPGIKISKTTLKENLADSEVQYKTLSRLIDRFTPDGIFPLMGAYDIVMNVKLNPDILAI